MKKSNRLKNTGKWIGLVCAVEMLVIIPYCLVANPANGVQYSSILLATLGIVWGAKAFKNHIDANTDLPRNE